MIRKKIAGLIVALAAVPSAAAEPSLQERAPLSHSVATMPPRFAFEIASSMAPDQGAEGVYSDVVRQHASGGADLDGRKPRPNLAE
jgi:hypothetical protein